MNRKKKNIILAVVVAIIVASISYLQASKSHIDVPKGSADLPLSQPLESNSCDKGYCTTTASSTYVSVSSKNTLSANAEAAARIIRQKAEKYPRGKELVAPSGFINTPPFKVRDLVGKKIILVDFWTYSCINCQRTLPYMNAWYKKYKDLGLEIIGVETPEFDFEKDRKNVEAAVQKFGVSYPVVQDNEYGTWNAYQNRYWPRKYLIDVDGFIVYDHIGEGKYEETELKIQELLKELAERKGVQIDVDGVAASEISKKAEVASSGTSPEIYFGQLRNIPFQGNLNIGSIGEATHVLPQPKDMSRDRFYLGGSWNIQPEYIRGAKDSVLSFPYRAKNVYLVAESEDGKPLDIDIYRDGVKVKTVTVTAPTLYTLITETSVESHMLEIRSTRDGIKLYTFTFG